MAMVKFAKDQTLFQNPGLAKLQWLNKLNKYRAQIRAQQKNATHALNPATHQASALTKDRLQLVIKALESQKQEVESLLESFDLDESNKEVALLSVLANRISSEQHILSYFQNIFRDWAWPTDDNKTALNCIKDIWPSQNIEKLVVLGSGAGRLAYDLAKNNLVKELLLIDINPLLLSVSQKMFNGETANLTEINNYPQSIETITKQWKLCAPKGAAPIEAKHIWGDAINLPFKEHSLTAVLTPWFIDIIPEDFTQFAKRLNTRLQNNGYWFNFGPLGFGGPENGGTYTKEELKQILDQSGFKIEDWQEKKVDYLNSPLSSQNRTESVILWRAKKIKDMVAPKDFSHYPDWLLNTKMAIPRESQFDSLAAQSQLELQILLSIDGKRSIEDIQNLMIPHLKVSQSEANALLLTFFINNIIK
jgi:N2227-like protein